MNFFFIPRSPRTTRNNRISPHNGPIKKFFALKSYYLCITNKEITQIPKSKSKNSKSCVPLNFCRLVRSLETRSLICHYSSKASPWSWQFLGCLSPTGASLKQGLIVNSFKKIIVHLQRSSTKDVECPKTRYKHVKHCRWAYRYWYKLTQTSYVSTQSIGEKLNVIFFSLIN